MSIIERIIVSSNKNTDSRRGAVGSKIGIADRWRAFVTHHRVTFFETLAKMLKEPLQTLMTSAVIAIALSLPTMLYLTIENIRQLEDGFESTAQITVYVDRRANQRAITILQDQLQNFPEVATVTFISAEQALKEFQTLSGFGSALQHLQDNPLPAVFLIEPKMAAQITMEQMKKLLEKINKLPIIEDAQIDMLWLQRLRGLTEIGRKTVLSLASILGLGVLLIVGNTIRLAIQSRRDEILITKLVGGTDSYVRRPFLYSGMLLGASGAILATFILLLGLVWLNKSVAILSDLYNSQYRLQGPGLSGFLTLIGLGCFLGVCGAWLAVSRHLRKIKPR